MRSFACLLLACGMACAAPTAEQLVSRDAVIQLKALRELRTLPADRRASYIPALIAELRANSDKNPVPAVHALATVGPAAAPELRKLLTDPKLRGRAVQTLAMMQPPAPGILELLRSQLTAEDLVVRLTAGQALLTLGHPEPAALAAIAEWKRKFSMTAGPPCLDISACIADLGDWRKAKPWELASSGDAAVPQLLEALASPNPDVRAGAATALSSMFSFRTDIEDAMIAAIHDPSARVRASALGYLRWRFSLKAWDSALELEADDEARKKVAEQRERDDYTLPHTLAQITADVPADPDHPEFAMSETDEVHGADGTVLALVTHSPPRDEMARIDEPTVLRVWSLRKDGYRLLRKWEIAWSNALSTLSFRYRDQIYLYIDSLGPHASVAERWLFRVAAGGLTEIRRVPAAGLPEGDVRKVWFEDFQDDDLHFSFSIWKPGEPNCCPTGGEVEGLYEIVGDELRVTGWRWR